MSHPPSAARIPGVFAGRTPRTAAIGLLATIALTATTLGHGGGPAIVDPLPALEDGFMTSHVVARLAPGASVTVDRRAPSVRNARGARQAALERSMRESGVVGVAPFLSRPPAHPDIAAGVGLDRFVRLLLAPGSDAIAVSAALLAAGGGVFEVVEPDGLGGVVAGGDDPFVPNDPDFGLQWSMMNLGQTVVGVPGVPGADVSAPEAWAITTGSPIVMAVLDSGVNLHPEVNGRVLGGYNAPNPGGSTLDGCQSHGTHVSGILGASGHNLGGIAGMSWAVEIMPVIVVDPCSGPESLVADGLVWAADNGARIANMSLQYTVGSAGLKAAVEYADALGVIMVAATGNNNSTVRFPAKWPETIAVAATNNLDQRWANSNFGPEVDLAAPGVNIWSLSGTNSYAYKTGTSMATPHVAGTVALMLSINPDLDTAQVRQILTATADDVDAPGYDVFTGHGRLNAAAALLATLETMPPSADLNGDGVVDGADLGILLNSWGPCTGSPCVGDLNGDGVVDGADLGLLLNAWGDGSSS